MESIGRRGSKTENHVQNNPCSVYSTDTMHNMQAGRTATGIQAIPGRVRPLLGGFRV